MPRHLLRDVGTVVLVHLAAACVIGLALPHLADLAQAVRTDQGVVTGESELGKTFNDDGWLIVLGGAAGLVLGLVLPLWRRGHEVLTLLATAVCAYGGARLAGWIAERTGPGDVASTLADADVGTRVSVPVVIDSDVAYLVWPLCATVAALVALVTLSSDDAEAPRDDLTQV